VQNAACDTKGEQVLTTRSPLIRDINP